MSELKANSPHNFDVITEGFIRRRDAKYLRMEGISREEAIASTHIGIAAVRQKEWEWIFHPELFTEDTVPQSEQPTEGSDTAWDRPFVALDE